MISSLNRLPLPSVLDLEHEANRARKVINPTIMFFNVFGPDELQYEDHLL